MELTKFFSKFGDVRDAKIITDRDGGKSRGYDKLIIIVHKLFDACFTMITF